MPHLFFFFYHAFIISLQILFIANQSFTQLIFQVPGPVLRPGVQQEHRDVLPALMELGNWRKRDVKQRITKLMREGQGLAEKASRSAL